MKKHAWDNNATCTDCGAARPSWLDGKPCPGPLLLTERTMDTALTNEPSKAMLEAGVAVLRTVAAAGQSPSPADIVRAVYLAMVAARGPFFWHQMPCGSEAYCTPKNYSILRAVLNTDGNYSAWIGDRLLVGSTYPTIDAAKRAAEQAYLGVPFKMEKPA